MNIALVEQSTSLERPETVVKFVTSERKARQWLGDPKNGRFTSANPDADRNHHHTFRKAFMMPFGWRRPSRKRLDDLAWKAYSPTYRTTPTDILASIVEREGKEIFYTP